MLKKSGNQSQLVARSNCLTFLAQLFDYLRDYLSLLFLKNKRDQIKPYFNLMNIVFFYYERIWTSKFFLGLEKKNKWGLRKTTTTENGLSNFL